MSEKITVKLSGANGNIFSLLGIASKAMKRAGQRVEAQLMGQEVLQQHSYDEALQTIMKYVDVT